jgi:DNA repair protein RadC
MKDLLLGDRPREKLRHHGAAALGDNELVALVLGSGSRRGDALSVANAVLAAFGGVPGLRRCSIDELVRIAGIGRARAAQIVAALELGRRSLAGPPGERCQIRTPREAAEYLLPRFGSGALEQFGIVLLDTKHRVLRTAVLALGTQNSCAVEPRDVFREAAIGGAAAIVIFHTHPSGDPSPSPDDVDVTRRLVAAGVLMGIDVVDHLILGDSRYWSLTEAWKL